MPADTPQDAAPGQPVERGVETGAPALHGASTCSFTHHARPAARLTQESSTRSPTATVGDARPELLDGADRLVAEHGVPATLAGAVVGERLHLVPPDGWESASTVLMTRFDGSCYANVANSRAQRSTSSQSV